MSVWDSPNGDQTVLLNWMTEHMNADCSHEILEVCRKRKPQLYYDVPCADRDIRQHLVLFVQIQEAFAYGLGEITRARATEKVSAGTAQMADRTAKAVKDFDTKMRISERTGHAVDAVSQSSVVQSTGAALTKAGSSVKNATMKVMEQPAVANAAESVGTGFRKLTASLSSMVGGRPPNPADVPHATTADP